MSGPSPDVALSVPLPRAPVGSAHLLRVASPTLRRRASKKAPHQLSKAHRRLGSFRATARLCQRYRGTTAISQRQQKYTAKAWRHGIRTEIRIALPRSQVLRLRCRYRCTGAHSCRSRSRRKDSGLRYRRRSLRPHSFRSGRRSCDGPGWGASCPGPTCDHITRRSVRNH
jgi:hypothetical protein